MYTHDPTECVCGSRWFDINVRYTEGTAFSLDRTNQSIQKAVQEAVEREREACALAIQAIADGYDFTTSVVSLDRALNAIRARSEKKE